MGRGQRCVSDAGRSGFRTAQRVYAAACRRIGRPEHNRRIHSNLSTVSGTPIWSEAARDEQRHGNPSFKRGKVGILKSNEWVRTIPKEVSGNPWTVRITSPAL